MKRLLGSLVVVTALTLFQGCGDEPGERADDPATQSQDESSDPADQTSDTADHMSDPADQSSGPGTDPRVVEILSGTAAGGEVAEEATVITDEGELERYLRQFDSPPFVGELMATIQTTPPAAGRVLGLAVIEISCDQPPSATVTEEDGAYVVSAAKVVNPHPECYAPVTSVAVLDLPAPE